MTTRFARGSCAVDEKRCGVPGRGRAAFSSQHWQHRELPAEDWLAWRLQPLLQNRGVDTAEIDAPLEIARVQVRQRRMTPDDARPQLRANEEHRRRGAVIGAAAGVLLDPAA